MKATYQKNVTTQFVKDVSNNYPIFFSNEVIAFLKGDLKVEREKFREEKESQENKIWSAKTPPKRNNIKD